MSKLTKMISNILSMLLIVIFVSACGSSSSSSGVPSMPISTLYTGDTGVQRVAAWESANTADGDIAPDRVITGATSEISAPYDLSYDSRSDSLFVGNLGTSSIKIYDSVSAVDGDIAPSRELIGAATLLDGGAGYVTAIDEVRDILYVSYNNGVLAFSGASTIDGNVAPTANITGASTVVGGGGRDKRLFIDEVNDRLYVTVGNQVAVFDSASTKDGDVAPDRVIVGAATGFSFLWGISVDVGRDILYVADETLDKISIFDNASTITGNVAPDRLLDGAATLLNGPADIYLDEVANTLYSTNEGASSGVVIWNNASTVDGDIAPDRVITGATTGISNVDGIVGAR